MKNPYNVEINALKKLNLLITFYILVNILEQIKPIIASSSVLRYIKMTCMWYNILMIGK